MEPNKVIVHFKDDIIMKGRTSDFFPNKTEFHLTHLDGKVEQVEVEKLKGIFFVKDFGGNPNHKKNYNDNIPGAGRKIAVDFNDGEQINGYAVGYSPDRQGFFMTPADLSGNNERIFIVKSATKDVRFL